jgi:pterin-4a-carbinolamine dehydratase
VGEMAESFGHHPDLSIKSWNQIYMTIYTYKVNGLTSDDFTLAKLIDSLPKVGLKL